MMQASKLDILIDALEVEVQADYNDGALFGATTDVPSGYLEVRYTVTVESDASENELMHMFDEADRHSPYFDVFSRGQKCVRTVNIVSSKPQA